MKVALFSETYLPQINGVATHVKTLKEGLEALGHQVLVVTADPAVSGHRLEGGVLRCPAMELKEVYGYGLAPSYSGERMHMLRAFAPDVVHAHTEFGIGSCAAELARELRVPLVYTLHTMWDDYLHYVATPAFLPAARKLAHAYFRRFALRADAIIGPSGKSRDFLRRCGVDREVEIIPNAVELERFSRSGADPAAGEALRRSYGIEPNDTVVCFCGRLGQEKGVDVLLEFFSRCRRKDEHVKLLLIGDGPARAELEAQARRLGLGHAAVFTGGVPHDAMREVYACCDLYATASRSEVNSISMLEAMAMGLPVLHILDEANPGQVSEGINGYVFRTGEELTDLILRFRDSGADEKARLRTSTSASVKGLGQTNLAQRVEAVYLRQTASGRSVEKDVEKEAV